MHLVAIIVMIIGVVGFGLNYAGMITLGTPLIWGGIAGAGTLVTILTRRPSD